MPLTQFERWTDYGEQQLLRCLTGDGANFGGNLYCRLFKLIDGDIVDPLMEDLTEADITEADFEGYSPVGFGFGPPADPGGTGEWEALAETICTFTRQWETPPPTDPPVSGTSNTIYGYYLTSSNSGHVTDRPLYYRFFNDGTSITPKVMDTPEVSQITVIPRLGLIGLEDVVCP